jgi:hypothetical protein
MLYRLYIIPLMAQIGAGSKDPNRFGHFLVTSVFRALIHGREYLALGCLQVAVA